MLDQIDNPRELDSLLEERKKIESERKAAQAERRVKLSLVNTEEFEDWLAVANIISRSERSYEKYLQEIRARLGMLVDSWGHVEANPLGTAVFAHAFDGAIRKVDLTKEIRQKVYSGFESKAIPLFRKLYVAVTRLLEDSKLFPDLDEDYISPVSSPVKSPEPGRKTKPLNQNRKNRKKMMRKTRTTIFAKNLRSLNRNCVVEDLVAEIVVAEVVAVTIAVAGKSHRCVILEMR